MAINNWPTVLGSPIVSGNTFSPPVVTRRQNVMRGPPRFRPETINKPWAGTLQFIFYGAQVEIFERFYWETLNAGTNQCRMNMYMYNSNVPNSIVFTFYPYTLTYDNIIYIGNVSIPVTFYPNGI